MARINRQRNIAAYRLKGEPGEANTVKVGDVVLMAPVEGTLQYIGKVERLFHDPATGKAKVKVRWYYRPHEAKGGRRTFHGKAEVFLSDHHDEVWAEAIVGKCRVHSFRKYTSMEDAGPNDFYCRFEYMAHTGTFIPDKVPVYCICEMPYNPDDPMVQCELCRDWYHLACLGLTKAEVMRLTDFFCEDCALEPSQQSQKSSIEEV